MRHLPLQISVAIATLCIIALIPLQAQANRLHLDNKVAVSPLGTHGFYLEDQKHSFDIDSIVESFDSDLWTKGQEDILSFGYTESAYWFHSPLKNTSTAPIERLLEIAYPVLDNIDVYIIKSNGTMNTLHLGDKQSYRQRPVDHSNFVIPIRLEIDEEIDVVLRFSTSSSMQIPVTLWETKAMLEQEQNTMIKQGLYYGAMIIMAIYNILIFISVRDINFLFYVMYVTCIALFLAGLNGLNFKFLWPDSIWWNDISIIISLSGTVIFASLFTRNFLSTTQGRPILSRLLLITAGLGFTCCVLSFFLSYYLVIVSSIILSVLTIICCFTTGIIRWHDGLVVAKYYNIAWSFMLSGGLVLAFNKLGIIPRNWFTENAVLFGSAMEVVLLSLALASRLNTERKLRESAQQESIEAQGFAVNSLEQYKQLYNNAIQGLFVLDAQGNFTRANPSLGRILGESPENLIASADSFQQDRKETTNTNKNISAYFPEMKALLKKGNSDYSGEGLRLHGNRSDGSDCWTILTLLPVFNTQKVITSFEGSMIDISESIQKEESDRKRQAAEAKANARSAFLANMSHEIRTPMNGVLGMLELLKGTKLDAHQQKYLDTINHSSAALLNIINDILDFSKIESGEFEVNRVSVSLLDTVDECLSVFFTSGHEKGLQIYFDFDPNIPKSILSDPARIRQIVLNLLSNAFKFTERGHIIIKADYLKNNMIEISVEDTGIGIPTDQQDKLFKSFSQSDSSTTRKYGGTGLGLFISKKLTELLGGNIFVESKNGIGSRFSFTIKDYTPENEQTPSSENEYRIPEIGELDLVIIHPNTQFATSSLRIFRSIFRNVEHLKNRESILTYLKTIDSLDSTALKQQRILLHESQLELCLENKTIQKIKEHNQCYLLCRQGYVSEFEKKIPSHCIIETPLSFSHFIQTVLKFNTDNDEKSLTSPPQKDNLAIEGLHFLVAEDNMVNQMVIKGILKKYGASCDIANNGNEAFNAYCHSHDTFDVVLMDIEMPIENGCESTKRIREYEGNNHLSHKPIFALSAHVLDEYIDQANEVGMDDFIAKPLTLEHLSKALQRTAKSLR